MPKIATIESVILSVSRDLPSGKKYFILFLVGLGFRPVLKNYLDRVRAAIIKNVAIVQFVTAPCATIVMNLDWYQILTI